MRPFCLLILTMLLAAAWTSPPAFAQSASGAPRIEWEVKNRFRLFRSEADFQRHVAVERGESVLAAEQRLERESDGRGWARDTVERLCVDRPGRLMEICDRDGVRENYLSPRDHPIGVTLAGVVPENTGCIWTFDLGEGAPREVTAPCGEQIKLRVPYGRTTLAAVDIVLPDGTAQRVVAEIAVRDVLIAGMGDSIAAGEGNPDRPVRLSDEGFCFRRFLGGSFSEYYRPGRENFKGNKACVFDAGEDGSANEWARQSARWESGSCHRSLYGYQMRTALGLAVEQPHLAVTFIPLGCSGATVNAGLLGTQRISECPSPGTNAACPGTVRSQIDELKSAMALAKRQNPSRKLDLVLLTIGANDVYFSGLVANVIVESSTDRVLFGRGGVIANVSDSQKVLDSDLPGNFAKVRIALAPLLDGDLSRVVYVSYGNPALAGPDTPCPGGRDGFDIHPSFGADSKRLSAVATFVSRQFLPKIRALATCEGRTCRDPVRDRFTFVDSHQAAFAQHGFCARAQNDPEFDRDCFSTKGESFRNDPAEAAVDPLTCGRPASEYRPYAPRARWVRTANDSYFTAMSYPQGLSVSLQPANIHDATWGTVSAVYGGAIHPTAEGHAAMADAALPAVRSVLELKAPAAVQSGPLPPPVNVSTPPLER